VKADPKPKVVEKPKAEAKVSETKVVEAPKPKVAEKPKVEAIVENVKEGINHLISQFIFI
jgi:hypothetical protein